MGRADFGMLVHFPGTTWRIQAQRCHLPVQLFPEAQGAVILQNES